MICKNNTTTRLPGYFYWSKVHPMQWLFLLLIHVTTGTLPQTTRALYSHVSMKIVMEVQDVTKKNFGVRMIKDCSSSMSSKNNILWKTFQWSQELFFPSIQRDLYKCGICPAKKVQKLSSSNLFEEWALMGCPQKPG